jgi:hypothetical protein
MIDEIILYFKSESNDNPMLCQICHQLSINTSYATSCFHVFCYNCVINQTINNCPTCRSDIDGVIYDVVTNMRFKFCEIASKNFRNERSRASWNTYDEIAPVEFRMLVYLKPWFSKPDQRQYAVAAPKRSFCTNYRFNIINRDLINIFDVFLTRELNALCLLGAIRSDKKLEIKQNILNLVKKSKSLIQICCFNEIGYRFNNVNTAIKLNNELISFLYSSCSSVEQYDAEVVYLKNRIQLPSKEISDNLKISEFPIPVSMCEYKLKSSVLKKEGLMSFIRRSNLDCDAEKHGYEIACELQMC